MLAVFLTAALPVCITYPVAAQEAAPEPVPEEKPAESSEASDEPEAEQDEPPEEQAGEEEAEPAAPAKSGPVAEAEAWAERVEKLADEILRDFPEARVVHVLRDGRDVCVSMQMRAMGADWSPADRRTQIELWGDSVERGLRVLERHPERTFGLRYEDVKADPAREIARLYGFAGLPHDPERVARAARDSDFSRHTRTGDGLHLRKGVVGDWQNHFDRSDEILFDSLVGELSRRCGYGG